MKREKERQRKSGRKIDKEKGLNSVEKVFAWIECALSSRILELRNQLD